MGPPTCTLDPPRNEIKNPAITAVMSPLSGEAPEAIAKAMAKGSATIATVNPAIASLRKSQIE